MLLMPWGRVSCAFMATSVAMVIYAHSPHLNEPLRGGSLFRIYQRPKLVPRSRA